MKTPAKAAASEQETINGTRCTPEMRAFAASTDWEYSGR
jgi:hypothetical protein